MSEWISVKDKTYPHEIDVLVFFKRGMFTGMVAAGFFYDQWLSFETEDVLFGDVTHWMPLPGEPK
jgi:hypothetical protein